MDYEIRYIRQDEWPLLEDFLYEAIFVLRLYERLGFRIIGDGADKTEWLMVVNLNDV